MPVRPACRSPLDVAFSPDGLLLAVSDRTAAALVLIQVADGRVVREVALEGAPAGIAWSADGSRVYVAEGNGVTEVDPCGGVVRRLGGGFGAFGVAVVGRQDRLLVTDCASGMVSAMALGPGREEARVAAGREPAYLAVTPDETLAVVGNRLPAGDASDPAASAAVSLIDLAAMECAANIPLRPNSMNVRGVAVSPDGRWSYVVHNLGRAILPTEQVEYGWISANAVTVLDLNTRTRYATILLDAPGNGAANPWGAAVSPDGRTLWVALSGVHELGRLDLVRLHRLLQVRLPEVRRLGPTALREDHDPPPTRGGPMHFGGDAADAPGAVELVLGDLPADYGKGLYLPGVLQRIRLPGEGPRGVAVSPDGRRVAVACYFSGEVLLVDAETLEVTRAVPVGVQSRPDMARRGESLFHDATRCYERWMSCATCHPEGRADGLNWDLLNDGIGNPKNTKSLVLSHRTPPAMAEGIRPEMAAAIAAGFRHILYRPALPEDVSAVAAYLRSLAPGPSPHLAGGRLSAKALQGKAVFESAETGCAVCHPAPLFTDLKAYDVGTRAAFDRAGRFDTPTLVELWRTAPYLHHGKAPTLRDVLTAHNRQDRHGRTSHLSAERIDALILYLNSL